MIGRTLSTRIGDRAAITSRAVRHGGFGIRQRFGRWKDPPERVWKSWVGRHDPRQACACPGHSAFAGAGQLTKTPPEQNQLGAPGVSALRYVVRNIDHHHASQTSHGRQNSRKTSRLSPVPPGFPGSPRRRARIRIRTCVPNA